MTLSSHSPTTQSWHYLQATHLLSLLETDRHQGLSRFSVTYRLAQYGENTLTQVQRKSWLKMLLDQFQSPLVYLLIAAAFVAHLLQAWVDTVVMLMVVGLNTGLGFVQEAKATKAMESLRRTTESQATVIREGTQQQIPTTQLVPGDLVLLKAGDQVPADLRLLNSQGLQVNEAALTGASSPVEKRATDHLDEETMLGDRANMAYASTFVTYGIGSGVVVATGDATEMGKIGTLIGAIATQPTPLTHQINQLSHRLLNVILGVAVLNLGIGLWRGIAASPLLQSTIALIVGMLPAGLPAIVTLALTMGMARMARQNAVIRKRHAVETLAHVTAICTDITALLTPNQMSVQQIFAGGDCFQVSGEGYRPVGHFYRAQHPVNPVDCPALMDCLQAGALCNDSGLMSQDGLWQAVGDPAEAALLVSAAKADVVPHSLEAWMPRLSTVSVSPQSQAMATWHGTSHPQSTVVYVKGTVEDVLPRCDRASTNVGKDIPLNTARVKQVAHDMAGQGLRVLALARVTPPAGTVQIDPQMIAQGLTFLGLQGLQAPLCPDAMAAVRLCQTAGIDIKLTTAAVTDAALAMGYQMGIVSQPIEAAHPLVLSSQTIDALPDEAWASTVDHVSVFAGMTPEHNLRLVEALQYRGHVVAITGAGSRDAPALHQADIGMAMGMSGTGVAKAAANLVLTDDSFVTIQSAIAEGRSVCDNIIKAMIWTLPTNFAAGLVIVMATLFGSPLPITPLQVLWINTVTAVLLGSTLMVELKEPGIMQRSPVPPRAPLFNPARIRRLWLASLLLAGLSLAAYGTALQQGYSIHFAQTAAVNGLVGGGIALLLSSRSLTDSMFKLGLWRNHWLWGGIALTCGLQLLLTYIPEMNAVFDTEPITLATWAKILGAMFGVYSLIEVDKGFQPPPPSRSK